MKALPNLRNFKMKLTEESFEDVTMNFKEYKRFLCLISLYPHCYLVPTIDIDIIWHKHLRNKKLYETDCLKYFGFIPKHKVAKTKIQIHDQHLSFEKTKKLWYDTFQTKMDKHSTMAFCGFDGDGGGDGGNGNDDFNEPNSITL